MGTDCLRFTAGDIGEIGLGSTVVFIVEITLIQDLAEIHGNLRSLGKICCQLHKAYEVLSEVQHSLPVGSMDHLSDGQCFIDPQGHGEPGCELLFRIIKNGVPGTIVLSFPQCAVQDLTVINTAVGNI